MGAILYDSMLLVGVLVVAVALAMGAASLFQTQLNPAHPLYRAWLFVVTVLFYGYFWVHGGQTLGMRAWRLRVIREDGYALTWPDALTRFFYSVISWLPVGLGYWWSLIPPYRQTWHDRWSATRLVLLPKDR
jgi:uncharacterized RDD family membrane protein YckC